MAVLRRSCALNPRQPRSGVPACPWGTGRGRSGHRGAWINIGRHMSLCSSPLQRVVDNKSHSCSELQDLIEVGQAGEHFQATSSLCLLEGTQPVGEQALQRAPKLGWEISELLLT